MKRIKKLLSFFLAVIMIMSSIPAVIAQEADVPSDDVITNENAGDSENPGDNPATEPEPGPEPEADPRPDDIVGEIYLCTLKGKGLKVGHMWVYIVNTSDDYLKIGLYDAKPGEGVSLATFGFTRYDGIGVYYNMEALKDEKYCGEGYLYLKDSLTREEAEKITANILTANYWDPIFNCTTFACRIWNIGSGVTIIPMVLPNITRLQLLIYGGSDEDKMNHQPPENCYKHRGTGSRSYLEPCSQKSLDA